MFFIIFVFSTSAAARKYLVETENENSKTYNKNHTLDTKKSDNSVVGSDYSNINRGKKLLKMNIFIKYYHRSSSDHWIQPSESWCQQSPDNSGSVWTNIWSERRDQDSLLVSSSRPDIQTHFSGRFWKN